MPTPEQLEKILKIRQQDDCTLKQWPSRIRKTFVDFAGQEQPFVLRHYQIQAVLNMVFSESFVLGDDTGLGKTASSIVSCAVLWDSPALKERAAKVVVLTTKSATEQWKSEIERFTTDVKVIVANGTATRRKDRYRQFEQQTQPSVLILGYRTAVQDFSHLQGMPYGILILDEASAFKNSSTQVHQVCQHMARQASLRTWGLTATMIKNNLMEGYGIFRVIKPDLFGTKNNFMYRYAQVQMQQIRMRMIPVIVGYAPEQIEEFKSVVEPFYLGRPKHLVAKELPALTIIERKFSMSKEQAERYREALEGLLTVRNKEGELEDKEVTKLTAVIYCQQIVNHLELIGDTGESAKVDELMDLLQEGDLEGEKVIVFSRFRKMIDILETTLKKAKIPCVRITGDETPKERQKAAQEFQDPASPIKVVLITTAAAEAINLQAAKALVFFDTPWSGGDYIQILGRMIRLGSKHTNVMCYHLVARKSIDIRVMQVLKKKMSLIQQVLGTRLQGTTESTSSVIDTGKSDLLELFDSLKGDAGKTPTVKELTQDED